ncbi:hypothetical protein KC878_03800 [Candidatus Saccharibacteria bacterium]|nr:hypothetical protein [Candidatus Saccharibacteria bacterium]MCB9821732.1 hypothetical protein [Candidatus Nomurabacteria bacterium]
MTVTDTKPVITDRAIIFPSGEQVIDDPNAVLRWCTRAPLEAELDSEEIRRKRPHLLMCFLVDDVEVQRVVVPLEAGLAHHSFEYPGETTVMMVVVWPENSKLGWRKHIHHLTKRSEIDGRFLLSVLERVYADPAGLMAQIDKLERAIDSHKWDLRHELDAMRPLQKVTDGMDPDEVERLRLEDALEEAEFRLEQHNTDPEFREAHRPQADLAKISELESQLAGLREQLNLLKSELEQERRSPDRDYTIQFVSRIAGFYRSRNTGREVVEIDSKLFAPAKASRLVEWLASKHERAGRPAMNQCDRRDRALEVLTKNVLKKPGLFLLGLLAWLWNLHTVVVLAIVGIRDIDYGVLASLKPAWREDFIKEGRKKRRRTSRWFTKVDESGWLQGATNPILWVFNPLVFSIVLLGTFITSRFVGSSLVWLLLLSPVALVIAAGLIYLLLYIVFKLLSVLLGRPLNQLLERLFDSNARMERRLAEISCRVGGPDEPLGINRRSLPQTRRVRFVASKAKDLVCKPIAKVRPGDVKKK